MSGVGITGKIEPLNGGNFPVFEDINGQGGLRTVADIATRNLLSMTGPLFLKEGMLAYVQSTKCYYALAPDLVTWDFYDSNQVELGKQASWEISASTGSDNNSGLVGFPLATTDEFSRRLSPGGTICYLAQNTTLHIATGTYQKLRLELGALSSAVSFTINCDFSSVTDTLTSVINTVANVSQGRITVATGPITKQQRIRSTSGANINAVTYGEGPVNSSTDTFVKTWYPTADTLHEVNIANGTTVAIETLTVSIAEVYINPIRYPNPVTIRINDCKMPNGFAIPTSGGSASYILNGCSIDGGRSNGNVRLLNCKVNDGIQFSGLEYGNDAAVVLAGCLCTGTIIIFGIDIVLNVCCSCDAASWNLGGSSDVTNSYANSTFGGGGGGGACEWSNGSGLTAIRLSSGAAFFWSNPAIYGFGTPYDVGFNLASGTKATVNTIANVEIPSTQNVIMAGNNQTFAQLPGYYSRANCFFSINPDTGAAFSNT